MSRTLVGTMAFLLASCTSTVGPNPTLEYSGHVARPVAIDDERAQDLFTVSRDQVGPITAQTRPSVRGLMRLFPDYRVERVSYREWSLQAASAPYTAGKRQRNYVVSDGGVPLLVVQTTALGTVSDVWIRSNRFQVSTDLAVGMQWQDIPAVKNSMCSLTYGHKAKLTTCLITGRPGLEIVVSSSDRLYTGPLAKLPPGPVHMLRWSPPRAKLALSEETRQKYLDYQPVTICEAFMSKVLTCRDQEAFQRAYVVGDKPSRRHQMRDLNERLRSSNWMTLRSECQELTELAGAYYDSERWHGSRGIEHAAAADLSCDVVGTVLAHDRGMQEYQESGC